MRPSRPSGAMTSLQRTCGASRPKNAAEKRKQRHRAQGFRVGRGDRPRAEPAQRVEEHENRYQEHCNSKDLQHQIADDRSEDADPIVRRPSGGRIRGGIERRIKRRVRDQGKEKEDRRNEDQEPDQLIEPPVSRRSKDARDDVHFGVRSYRRTMLARTHPCLLRPAQAEKGHTTRSHSGHVVPWHPRLGAASTPEPSYYPKKVDAWRQKSSATVAELDAAPKVGVNTSETPKNFMSREQIVMRG